MMTLLEILVLASVLPLVFSSGKTNISTVLNITDLNEVLYTLKSNGFNDTDWQELGLSLGLHFVTLTAIEADCQGRTSTCLSLCLSKWLNRTDTVNSEGGASFYSLIAALRSIGKGIVAERFAAFGENSTFERGFQNGVDKDVVAKWLKEGTVNLTVKRVQMLGPPGSGKTCSLRLLLNEDPPEEDNSSPIACRAVKATRISVDDGRMERVDAKALLSRLACDLKEAKAKQEEIPIEKHDTRSKEKSTDSLKPETNRTESQDPHSNIILNEIVTSIPRAKANLKCNWVYIVDSGGQTAFQELLPLFTRAASLNIITIDLSKGMNEKLDLKYRIKEKQFSCDSNFSYTNIKFVKDVLSFGAILQPYSVLQSKKAALALQYPEYFILGTHSDNAKVTPQMIADFNKELSSLTSGSEKKGYRIIPAEQNGDIIYPVNTMLKPGPKRLDESKNLCATLFDFSDDDSTFDDTFEMPVRWFAFELTLLEKAGNYSSILEMRDVLFIGKSLQMDEDDTRKALEYLHNVTIILYYPQVLPDIVFVDPHPILNILSRLLALTCKINGSSLHLFTKKRPLESELDDLRKRGIFTKSLLDKLKDDQGFLKSDFINLLLYLHIITETQDGYFIPSALPPYTGPPPDSDVISPLLIIWQNPHSVTEEILPVPRGIFTLTIVNLMKFNELQFHFPPTTSQNYLRYRDAMSFRIFGINEHIGTIHFIKTHRHMEIHFIGHKNDTKYCSLIREAVSKAIINSTIAINLKLSHKFAFPCCSSKKCEENCYYIVTNEAEEKVECTSCTKRVNISGQENYWNWFRVTHQTSNEVDMTHLQQGLNLLCISFANAVENLGQKAIADYMRSESYWCVVVAIAIVLFFIMSILIITTCLCKAWKNPIGLTPATNIERQVVGNIFHITLDKKIHLQEIIKSLNEASFRPSEWKKLGDELGLYDNTLDSIATNNRHDVEECLREMLVKWLGKADNASEVTWSSLLKALEAINQKAVAENIRCKLQKKTTVADKLFCSI